MTRPFPQVSESFGVSVARMKRIISINRVVAWPSRQLAAIDKYIEMIKELKPNRSEGASTWMDQLEKERDRIIGAGLSLSSSELALSKELKQVFLKIKTKAQEGQAEGEKAQRVMGVSYGPTNLDMVANLIDDDTWHPPSRVLRYF